MFLTCNLHLLHAPVTCAVHVILQHAYNMYCILYCNMHVVSTCTTHDYNIHLIGVQGLRALNGNTYHRAWGCNASGDQVHVNITKGIVSFKR